MKQHKTSLDLISWDGTSNENNKSRELSKDSEISKNKNSNSNCLAPLLDYKSIKINLLDISKLAYNSTIIQYNNWLVDLKTDFDKDPARFPTSHQKIILVSIILDKQLKTTFNSAAKNSLILSQHWHKFEHWLRDIILYDSFDKLKLSKEFTTTHQIIKKNLNQFYLRLFNLEI